MTEMIHLELDLATGHLSLDVPENRLEEALSRVASFIPTLARTTGESPERKTAEDLNGQGVDTAQGGSGGPSSAAKPRISRKTGSAAQLSEVDLGLSDEQKREMTNFFRQKAPKTQNDKVLVCLYWLKKYAAKTRLDVKESFSALRVVGERAPRSLSGVLANLVRASLATRPSTGQWAITHLGEDRVEKDLPTAANDG